MKKQFFQRRVPEREDNLDQKHFICQGQHRPLPQSQGLLCGLLSPFLWKIERRPGKL